MTIQPIGSASVALYITPTDLKERGLTPAGLTLERALELTRDAFAQAGITLDGAIEIEAYPDESGVLVFARVSAPERLWFSFDELESLLAAARSLPVPRPDAALLWWEGRYWLSLPAEAEQAANRLSDFGRAEMPLPHQQARLAEYGRMILDCNALGVLLCFFPV